MMAGEPAEFSPAAARLRIDDDLELLYWQPLLPAERAERIFRELLDALPWQQPSVRIFGKRHPVPRLQSWHGDPEAEYRYSGMTLTPEPWTPALERVREAVSRVTGTSFNSVLANLYRDGLHTMGWHADDEPELGPDPEVASVSLGTARDLALRRRGTSRTHSTLRLEHNSLLWMPAGMQRDWQHALPRRKRAAGPRINLTFRRIGADSR